MATDLDPICELVDDFGSELIGVSEFAELVGFDRSAAAQVRAERKRDQAGFPPVVSESGRSFLHRLADLVEWVEHSRYRSFVDIQAGEIAVWRLQRRMRTAVEQIGVTDARRLLAGLALTARDTGSGASGNEFGRVLLDGIAEPGPTVSEVSKPIAHELARDSVTSDVVDRVLVDLGSNQPGIPNRSPAALARLAAIVLDARTGDVVYEPTSGEREILLRVAELAAVGGQRLGSISGSDQDEEASLIGQARFELVGIDAQTDAKPSIGSVDRLVVDPGGRPDRRDLTGWVRLLGRKGRVVVITKIGGADEDLVAELPPTAIVFPPQRPAGTQGAIVLWVSEPFCDPPEHCVVVDLRSNALATGSSIEARLEVVTEVLKLNGRTLPLTIDGWSESLAEMLASEPQVLVVSSDRLEQQLTYAVSGTLGLPPDVVEQNEQYAISLARELERLIGGRPPDKNQPTIERPADSPDGILASKATDEARRVVARLSDAFAGVRQWKRRST